MRINSLVRKNKNMFHIDVTIEDCRLLIDSENGSEYKVRSVDNHSGKEHTFTMTQKQVTATLAIIIDIDGAPEGVDKMYKSLEPLMVNCPKECRPIL